MEGLPAGLTSLSLDFAGMWNLGVGIARALAEHMPPKLRSLSLNLMGLFGNHWDGSVQLDPAVADERMRALVRRFPAGLSTLKLELSENDIGDGSLRALGEYMRAGLSSLDIDFNCCYDISEVGVRA